MSRARLLNLGLALVFASTWVVATAHAQPSTRAEVYTASVLPRLATRGVEWPAGKATLKVWTPSRQVWSLTAEGSTVTLRPSTTGDVAAPRWQTVGVVEVQNGVRLKIVVAGEAKKKIEKSNAVALPAILTLSSDPQYDPAPALELIRARLDTVEPTADPRREHVRSNREGANFDPPATAQAWRDRAAQRPRATARHARPLADVSEIAIETRVLRRPLRRDGYTIERFSIETFPDFTCAGNLYRPADAAQGKRPVVLCPHGHWEDGRVNPEVQQRCIRLAKLGFVVVMYDMVGYNDSKAFGHAFLNDRLRRWGLSLPTLQTWNSIRVLDWVSTLPDVDPERIGCTGESGGGTQTFLLTAIDPRVKVAAPVVMVSEYFQGGCVCENCAGLRIGTDNMEFAALTAPRPLKLVGATGDWSKHTLTITYPTLENIYRLLGTPERISAEIFDFPHNYNQTSRNAVYPFLTRWLMGDTDAKRTKEGPQTPEKPEDLWAFTEKHPSAKNAQTPETLEHFLIELRTRELAALAPKDSAPRWEAAKALLQTSHAVRVGVVNPPPAELIAAEVRRSQSGQLSGRSLGRRPQVGGRVDSRGAAPPNAHDRQAHGGGQSPWKSGARHARWKTEPARSGTAGARARRRRLRPVVCRRIGRPGDRKVQSTGHSSLSYL